jgi:DNA polymerase alpha subunit A
MNYDVIYGDTDSIMINTNSTDYDQVMSIGANVKFPKSFRTEIKNIHLDSTGN